MAIDEELDLSQYTKIYAKGTTNNSLIVAQHASFPPSVFDWDDRTVGLVRVNPVITSTLMDLSDITFKASTKYLSFGFGTGNSSNQVMTQQESVSTLNVTTVYNGSETYTGSIDAFIIFDE